MAEELAFGKKFSNAAEESEKDKKINAELRALGIEDLDNFKGSAEEALEKIKEFLSSYAEVIARLTPEFLEENPDQFRRDLESMNQRGIEFNIISAMFKVQVETQYPRVPLRQMFAVFVLGIFRGAVSEAVILQTFGGNRRKRKILLNAWKELNRNFAYCRDGWERASKLPEEKRLASIKLRQVEILRTDEDYQSILEELDEAIKEQDAKWWNESVNTDRLEAEVEKWETKKERKEQEALVRAEAEFSRPKNNITGE